MTHTLVDRRRPVHYWDGMNLLQRIAASMAATAAVVIVLSAAGVALVVAMFGHTVSGALALYFVIWWTFLFAVLPFGVRSQAEEGEVVTGSEPGAPTAPRLREKAIGATLVAVLVLIITAVALPWLEL